MKFRNILYLIFFLSIISCKPVVTNLYGINKKSNYKNKEEYLETIKKLYKIDFQNLYFVESEDYSDFMHNVAENKIDYFYGTFISVNKKLEKSKFLSENQSCSSRVLNEINSIENLESKNYFDDNLFQNKLKNIKNNKEFTYKNGSKVIVIIISPKFGKFHKNDFKEVENIVSSKNDYQVVFIAVDDISNLN